MIAGAICMIKPSTSIVPQFGEGALGKWDEERNFIVTDAVPFTFPYSSSCIRLASFFSRVILTSCGESQVGHV